MHELTVQGLTFPTAYITALSYAKRARTYVNSRGFARFRGYDASEISLRITVDRARAMLAERDFEADVHSYLNLSPIPDSTPTIVSFAGHLLYPSLQFRVSSVTCTVESDQNGFPVAMEADITLSGVAVTKYETTTKAVASDDDDAVPAVTIRCKGKSLKVELDVKLSKLIMHPDYGEMEVVLGNDQQIVQDAPWMIDLVKNEATVSIDGYGEYFIVSANLVDGVLSAQLSAWKKLEPVVRSFSDSTLNVILHRLYPGGVSIGSLGRVDYAMLIGEPRSIIASLQESAGFLIDYRDGVSFVPVPKSITPEDDFDVYLDDDLSTEEITGLIWSDSSASHTAGSSPSVHVRSCFQSANGFAEQCLDYYRYMQNSIKITMAIDPRIRHHSAITVVKDDSRIPCMVEDYEIDFVGGVMTVDAHYVDRGLS